MQLKKIAQRIIAAAVALTTAITALPVTSLADKWGSGLGSGDVHDGAIGKWLYGYNSYNNLSWKVDLYVSGSDTGKIDPTKDKIGVEEVLSEVLFSDPLFLPFLLFLAYSHLTRSKKAVIIMMCVESSFLFSHGNGLVPRFRRYRKHGIVTEKEIVYGRKNKSDISGRGYGRV